MPPDSTISLIQHFPALEIILGIFLIGLVLGVNGFAYSAIILFFRANLGRGKRPSKFTATFFFILCTQLLALTQLLAIFIWATALFLIEITPDMISSVRLSASSYTTLGDFQLVLPDGWHLMPALIAFSGLFSFSWAATSTISMVSSLNSFLDQSKHLKP
jgi:hypothetical protein